MLCAAVRAEAVARRAVGATMPIWACARRTTFLVGTVHLSTLAPATAAADPTALHVDVERGLPRLCVPLPSRKETCVFTLKPVSHSVGDFLSMLRAEDAGIDRAVCRTVPDGHRIASTTSVQTLLQSEFDLVVNDKAFRVAPPPSGSALALADASADQRLGDVRALVGQLYEALNVEEYYVDQEQKLVKEMESLKQELEPLEKKRAELADKAERRANNLTWVGLGLMSVQFGVLARLTWWEYSWDIMEPVTYFVTYGTAMACYAYFVLTRQDYVLPDVRDRQFLFSFYKRAKREGYSVERYNAVKDGLTRVELELDRLRDPVLRTPLKTRVGGQTATSLLASQINVGNLKNLLKGKLS